MGRVFHRIISAFLTAVFVLSAVVTGTYSWYSIQSVTNETAATIAQVQLLKLQKLPDGTETDTPVPGGGLLSFYSGRRTDRRPPGHRRDGGDFPCACPQALIILKNLPRRRRLLLIRQTGSQSHNIHLPCRREARSR